MGFRVKGRRYRTYRMEVLRCGKSGWRAEAVIRNRVVARTRCHPTIAAAEQALIRNMRNKRRPA